jgi:hypothetical protein
MPREAQVLDSQTMEVGINGPDKANRMYIATGKLDINWAGYDTHASGYGTIMRETFTALIDPQLEKEQFHRSVAMASLATFSYNDQDSTQNDGVQWAIEEAQVDFDDESGKVQLRVAVMLKPQGKGCYAAINQIAFQVTTLARI